MLGLTEKLQRRLAALGVVLLLCTVVITIVTPRADGYEISIYESFAWYYWVLVVGTLFVGSLTIVTSALSKRGEGRLWVVGLVTVLLMNTILLLMPYIRGYAMYGRADPMTHLGYIQIITETGVAGGGNIYPNTHLLIRILGFSTGLTPMTVLNSVAPVATAIYFGAMYLLLREVFESRSHVLLGLPFALLPVYDIAHLGTTPFRISVLLVPLLLYFFIKDQRTGSMPVRVALAVTVISMVIFHPLTAIFLISVFALHAVVTRTWPLGVEQVTPTNIASLLLVVFTAWYQNFSGIIIRLEGIVGVFLFDESGEAPLESYSATVSSTSPELVDVIRVGVFKYGLDGSIVLFGLCALAFSLYLWWKDEYESNIFVVVFGASLLVFAAGSVAFLVFDLIVGMGRPLQFAKVLAVLLGGGLLYQLYQRSERGGYQLGFEVSVATVLLVLVVLSTFTLYWSPLSSQTNQQMTEMELDGGEWLFENRNSEQQIQEFGVRQYRLHDALYGVDARSQVRQSDTFPPARFNYTVRPNYGANYVEDQYLVITQRGRVRYPKTYPDYQAFWKYMPQDYARLERDQTINRLYDSGDFVTYGVDGTRPADSATGLNQTASEDLTGLSARTG
jgi:hypothetical protein